MNNKEMTLKQLVAAYPEVKAVFDKYRIDYTQGEMDTLEEATMIVGLRPDVIFEAMNGQEQVA